MVCNNRDEYRSLDADAETDTAGMERTLLMEYWRYNARLGCWGEMTEKEFNRKIKQKYVLPVYDDYFQEFSENTYYDSRDSIVTVFYIRR